MLRAEGVSREFGSGDAVTRVLHDCGVEVFAGQTVAIVGKSGSGKSTFANCLSGLDKPTTGRITLLGHDLATLDEKRMARLRAEHIGFVLQKDNLVPTLNIEENVAAPLIMSGVKLSAALKRAREALDQVSLSHRARSWPGQVSGGEAQRAAVARACVNEPSIVFADEPTGALDEENGLVVQKLFRAMVKERGAASVIVTHDLDLAQGADVVVRMAKGTLVASGWFG
ncbi:putative ABC transport system ATP-binding protein/lipoprotein-releasing system ATP-binding protein [Umezawaea tangerina]|uniref:Putative ABC transport system ATP-binding protein/lipoprotein-releasing system ATP-binding protein n=1 Tax=Umezawaea tangerina TaxID=84725 RepID=A0A2T0T2I6_9PSEU|nr:putative ABC transport system ATP-binding protein/lipoprotein-releasing system ATP-binding protein [Umezawaea tangerina]